MSAELFIAKLEDLGLLDDRVLSKLRAQIAKPGKTPSAQAVAKFLIEKGQLTEFQAKKLLDETAKKAKEQSKVAASDDLGLAEDAVAVDALDVVEEVEPEEVPEAKPVREEKKRKKRKREVIEVVEPLPDEVPVEVSQVESLDDFGQLGAYGNAYGAAEMLSDPLAAGQVAEAVYESGAEEKPAAKAFRSRQEAADQWSSKWVLILPAVLVILILAGVLIYFMLFRKSADQLYELAEGAYQNQNYGNAIEVYETFSKSFKKDPRAKIADARISMCRMRVPFESKSWETALEVFKENLPVLSEQVGLVEDSSEKENLYAELAGLLPNNVIGFIEAADKTKKVEEAKRLLDLADENMALVLNGAYIPKSEREKPVNQKRISEITESIAKVRRKVEREDKLVAALAKISTKVDSGDTPGAAQEYDGLLREYPELRSEPRLAEAIQKVSQKQQDLVKVGSEDLPNTTQEVVSDTNVLVLATRVGKSIDVLQGEIQPLLVQGAIYGVDVGRGEIVWRYFVGYETQIEPQIFDIGQRRILAADQKKNELICLNPADGKLVWKTSIGESLLKPLIMEDQIFVTTDSGKIITVEALDGRSTRFAAVPQQFHLSASPLGTSGRRRLLQVGDHTNLYVFSTSDMKCTEVYYLGHQQGAIEAAPLVVSGHILIAENKSKDRCELHVLKNAEDGRLQRAQNPELLDGRVVVDMALYGRRALVITENGTIVVYEIDLSTPERPLKRIAEAKHHMNPSVVTRYLAQEGKLWVGDIGLTRYDIQTQRGELARQHVSNAGDTFVGSIASFPVQHVLLHVRRRRGSAMISISAVNEEDHVEIWRLDMAAPLPGGPFVEGKGQQFVAVNAQGDFFAVNQQAITKRFVTAPIMRASTSEQDLNFKYQVDLGTGDYVFVGPPDHDRLLLFRPSQDKPLKLVELKLGENVASGAPAAFDGKVLISTVSGLVQLVDPTADGLPARFSPELEPNSQISWQKPAVIDATTFAIADQSGRLYTVQKQGADLRMLNRATVAGKIIRPLAVVAGHVMAVVADGRQHKLLACQLPNMEARTELSVPGAVEFGPFAIDQNHVIIGTDLGRLICADSAAQEVWSADIGGTFASGATADGGKLAVTLVDGRILWLNAADGAKIGESNMSEPTVRDLAFPVIYDGSLYLGGSDGTLHITKVP